MNDLVYVIRSIVDRITRAERRLDTMVRHGPVEEVNAKDGTARIRIGGTDEKPQLSPWIPYGQHAGKLKVHSPPSKGQQLTMLSPTGDFRQSVAMPLTWSDKEKSPSEKDDENVLTYGNVRATIKDGLLEVKVGDSVITAKSGTIELKVGGSTVTITANDITAKSEKIITDGETKLDKGDARVETEAGTAKRVYAKV
jgi:phage baseplate assembly protein V